MKKTFNINVAGFPFIIDDDAYTLLNDYLNTVEHAFSTQEDGMEIVSDIESRVAELLLERSAEGSPIITASDVEQVISRVGKPEEMFEETDAASIDETSGEAEASSFNATPPPYIPPVPPVKRKLYRDPQNAMLGGVCSGLGWYMNTDPTPIRLITVLLTVISVATCGLAYLILWIVIPEAGTPLERMQMMGEEPTVENIGKTVTDNFREDSNPQGNQFKQTYRSGFGATIATIFSIIVKVLIVIGMVLAVIVLGAMVIGLFGCVFALIMFGTSWGGTVLGEVSPFWDEAGNLPLYGVLCGIGSILILGIPLFLLVRKGWKNATPLSQSMKLILSIVWAIGFLLAAVSTGRIVNLVYEEENSRRELRKQRLEYVQEESGEEYVADGNETVSDQDSTVTGKTVELSDSTISYNN